MADFLNLQNIFGKLDVDHDGDITEEEFIQVVLKIQNIHNRFFGHNPADI